MINPRALLVQKLYLKRLQTLSDKYRLTVGMTVQQVFDAFVAVEQSTRSEFMRRGESHTDPKKRLYWFTRATGLTTGGGQNRLSMILTLASQGPSE